MADQPDKLPTLQYAQGGFEKPSRTWTLLGIFDVLAGVMLIWFNGASFAHTLNKLYGPPPLPAPWPDSSDVVQITIARWQHWTVLVDAAVSVALVVLLFVAVWAMLRPRTERLAIRLHVIYVWLKLILVLIVASLYGWNVDKARLDWGLFATTLMLGAIHPLMVIALVVQIWKQVRVRRMIAGDNE
jgi:hypothetical protein